MPLVHSSVVYYSVLSRPCFGVATTVVCDRAASRQICWATKRRAIYIYMYIATSSGPIENSCATNVRWLVLDISSRGIYSSLLDYEFCEVGKRYATSRYDALASAVLMVGIYERTSRKGV